jgi:D-aminopeptidase
MIVSQKEVPLNTRRTRLRDLGIPIGTLPTGPDNAITDVPGILVGHATVVHDEPQVARTGLTVILPRDGAIGHDYAFAGFHRFNGFGEFTGIQWLQESGLLTSAIVLSTTQQVGMLRDAMAEYSSTRGDYGPFYLPLVTETYDGWLNGNYTHLKPEHVAEAFRNARSGAVPEGCVGGGTGMICYDFKGGIGTASRQVVIADQPYTVGALVQTNHGDRRQLRVNGVPVGEQIGFDLVPSPWSSPSTMSSIVGVVGTDAPLLPVQCQRLAQRAIVGLARTGGLGYNSSGDFFLAFATGHHIPAAASAPFELGVMLPHRLMDPFFQAVAEAVEEAILNSLTAAETTVGFQGRTAYALPLEALQDIMAKYRC